MLLCRPREARDAWASSRSLSPSLNPDDCSGGPELASAEPSAHRSPSSRAAPGPGGAPSRGSGVLPRGRDVPQLAAPAGGDPAPALAPSSAVLRLFARGCDSASLVPSSSRTVPSFRKRAAPPAAAAAEAAAPAAAAACPSAPAAAGDVSRGDSSHTSFGVSPATPTLTLRVRGGPPPAGEVRESSEHEPVSEPNVSSIAPGQPYARIGRCVPRWPLACRPLREQGAALLLRR